MFQLRGGRSKLKQAPPVNLSEEIRGAKNKERRFPNRRVKQTAVRKTAAPLDIWQAGSTFVGQAFLPAGLNSQGKRERLPYNC